MATVVLRIPFRPLRNLVRLLIIARTMARYDCLFLLERLGVPGPIVVMARAVPTGRERSVEGRRPGQRLAEALHALGPTFIKVGQILSTRSDLLGEEMAEDLSHLQDALPPFPTREARATVEAELGRPLDALFADFGDEAVAAASIAQVHFATTSDGRDVAVKVLRPGVEDAFARDFDLFYWVASLIEATQPGMRRLKPTESVRTMEETVHFELDLRFEAAAAAEMGENFADDPDFHVPAIDWNRSGRRVMTMERISGTPIDEREALLAAGHDPSAVLEKAARAFFRMVFRDGLFHGDLHPGNLFVQQDGSIVAVDFGIMGRIDMRTRRHLAEMLVSFLTRNYRRAAEVHFEAGWVPADKSVDMFTQACRSIAEPILGRPQHEISMARLLAQLFQVTEYFSMETQPQLLLLQKTMLVAEGTGRALNPTANMWLLAQPLIEDWAYENMGPQASVRDVATDMRDMVERLPRIVAGLERSLASLAGPGVRIHPDSLQRLRRRSVVRTGMLAAILAILLVFLLVR